MFGLHPKGEGGMNQKTFSRQDVWVIASEELILLGGREVGYGGRELEDPFKSS